MFVFMWEDTVKPLLILLKRRVWWNYAIKHYSVFVDHSDVHRSSYGLQEALYILYLTYIPFKTTGQGDMTSGIYAHST